MIPTILTALKGLIGQKTATSVLTVGGAIALITIYKDSQFCATIPMLVIPALITIAIAYFIITLIRSKKQ